MSQNDPEVLRAEIGNGPGSTAPGSETTTLSTATRSVARSRLTPS